MTTALRVLPHEQRNADELPMTPLLDHGHVRLLDWMGNDLSIIRAARQSFNAPWRAGQDEGSDGRLMRRLWSGGKATMPEGPKHSTPFEAATVSFEIKAPIMVFRQWHRHRTQSYNEMSARYMELPEQFYVPNIATVGNQSADNKQGRTELSGGEYQWLVDQRIRQVAAQEEHQKAGFALYRDLLASGWPRELARGHLGVFTYSQMSATMNLLNCFRFLTLRADSHAQYEIRVYADAMLSMLRPLFPSAVACFEEGNS